MVFTAPFWGCLEGNTDQSASWRVRTPARQIAFELHPTRVVGDTAPLPSADPSSAGTYVPLPTFDHTRGGLKPRTRCSGWVLRRSEVVDGNGGQEEETETVHGG